MTKPDLRALREQAARACLRHAEDVLAGPLTVTIDASEAAWDPLWLRHVLVQRMTISQPVRDVEVFLDASHRVVGFVDHGAPPARGFTELAPDAIHALLAGTGLVSAATTVQGVRRTEDDRLELRLELPGSERRVARIDPVRGTVIALEPTFEEGEGA